MKNKPAYGLLLLIGAALNGCCAAPAKEKRAGITSVHADSTTVQRPLLIPDTISSKTVFTDTIPANRQEQLKPIRENFRRINAITTWTAVVKRDLWESTEGGVAAFYYLNGTLEKIIVRHFGEMYQQLTQYYLLNAQLSFVLERTYHYNRPMYYDSTAMKENGDTEAFDIKKSKITIVRGYLRNNRLIHLDSSDAASFSPGYLLRKEEEVKAGFEKYTRLAATK